MKRQILIAFVFLLSAISAYADGITASDITLTNDKAESLDISLANSTTNLVGLQFNLTLPEGVAPVMEEGKVVITPSHRLRGSYTLRGSKVANGSYLFTFLSSDRTPIAGTEGDLFTISLKNTSAVDGTYEASMSDVVATNFLGEELAVDGSSFNVKIVHKYNLTYNVDDEEYQSFVYAVGEEITPITEPTKEGYTFSGWSEIPETMPANDLTITGSFTVNKYKLSYVVDGVTTDSMMVAFGATITPKDNPTKEGATFSGWSGEVEVMPSHDVTVTGSFSTNSYHITYNVDGELYQEADLAYGAEITPATEPTKEGYTFSGWSEIPATMPANDVTITGSFTVNQYKLTYVVDGVATDSIMVDYGASITPKEEPSQEGATFSGWLGVPETMPAHDVTVTGSFGTNFYHITYMVDDALYQEGNIAYGAAITPATEPTKEGYTFSGWSEIPATMPANDVTITGSFTVNQYKLTYVVDDVVTDSMMVAFGATITPKDNPTKEGATFSGWSGEVEVMPSHDVTVTGSFSTNSYHITYNVDGELYHEADLAYGAAITPATEPTKEGYTFSGWSEIPETMPANDVTITGSFTVNQYKLTYVVDGVVTDSLMVDYGASITPKEEPSQEGATFSGWLGVPETMPAHDVTVTGSFGTNFYHITYMVDDALYQEGNIAYGAAITPATEPTKEGYTFSGWSEIPATMPANDVTITGSFTVNQYKLSYVVDGVVTDSMMVAFGATITPKEEPSQEGATFSGWSEIPETMPAHDVTVTGSFGTNFYHITYMVDDALYQEDNIAYGAAITPATEPTKEGYTFSGWSEIPETMPANDVTITGSFTVNKYKLTYVVDGVATDSIMVDYGASITPKEDPSQEGATFSGWLGVPETMPAHDVTVTGSFGTNFYHITYMVDETVYQEGNIAYGAAITPATEPTKEGYTFSGWSEIPAIMPANDVTITGSFTVNQYELTYVVDGVTTDSMMVAFGSTITPKDNPAKEGYTFSGWSEIPETMPANEVTVTGSFTVNQYKLTYVVDGVVTDSLMVDYGASITPKEEPSQEGATFSGWLGVPETMPAHDVTVTGSFGTNFYHITYMVDDALYQEDNIAYGAAITPATEPTKEGYTFSGWSEIPETMPANDVIVTGTFTVNKYKLTYVVDGVATDSIMIDYGASITPKEEPSQEGATFSGWLGVPETMPAHDVTVTGSFGTNFYHITYMVDETVYQEDNIAYGAAITPATEPTKEGYTFSGWSEIPATMPANDVTITGSFTVNQYKLSYVVDGVVTDSMMVAFGSTITPKDYPTKEGATFSGWDGEIEVMPSHDVTVTGSFSTNSYHITYMVDEDVYQEADLAYGETITPATEPTKEGYTFSGWSEIPATMPANDLTITGSFTINQYKLTYVVDGVTTDSMMVAFGATITPKEEPTKVGATFSGWDGEVEVMPSHDVTVTGSFSTNSYQITYMVDGVPYQQVELAYGAEITPATEPTKNGYTFSGWSEIPATMPANDLTITGSFTLDAIEPTEEGEVAVSDPEGALDIRLQGNREDIKILKIDGKVTDKDIETILTLDNLLAIYWNANVPLPLSIKEGRSRNLMVYVDDASKVENGAENWVNVIVNGNAFNVLLTDGEPLLIPEEFHADNALFIRESTMETVRESSAGWTSLVLPFDVQTIINENRGVIAPFGNDESDLHFWLMECADGFSKATSIVANKPYIVAMPNSPEYFDYYNITGKVAHMSDDVMVCSTYDAETDDLDDYALVSAYETVGMSDEVYALNKDTWYIGDTEYKPGSVFMRNSRDVNPFECYLVPKTHDARMRDFVTVGEMNAATDMPEVTMNSNDLRVSVANHSLVITSPRSQIIAICNIAGAVVRQVEIPSGSTTISDLPDGVYLVNGNKVALK